MSDNDCLFCKIVAGDIPAKQVRRTERVLAFRDINPKAPTHVLVIPLDHHATVADMVRADPELAAEVLAVAADVADEEGVADSGWRLLVNSGPNSGQEVFHVHLHVFGGKPLGPMLSD
ncbi:HIT family protein [Glycomyces tarimensis]